MEALFSDYEAIRKSGLFDPEHYATAYPDVAERNVDPLVHYLEEGAREGRDPHPDFDTAFYLQQCRARGEEPANPLLHYLPDWCGPRLSDQARWQVSGGDRRARRRGEACDPRRCRVARRRRHDRGPIALVDQWLG